MNAELEVQKNRAVGLTANPTSQLSPARQVLDFMIFLLAVLASRFLDLYRHAVAGNPLSVDGSYLLFAVIVSLAAFPVVYDRAVRSRNSPLLVHIALIFTTGLGWEKILSTVAKQ